MGRRGRPTLLQRTGEAAAYAAIQAQEPTKSDRTHQNQLYQSFGDAFIDEHADTITHAADLKRARGACEQIGRIVQAGKLDSDTIAQQAKVAADALHTGSTAKQAEAFFRHGRLNGDWLESLLTPITDSTKKDPEECEDCFVGRYTKEVPSDALSMLEAIMLINILDNVDNALHRKPLDLLEGETKADIIQTANAIRAKLARIYLDEPPWKKPTAPKQQGPQVIEVTVKPTHALQGPKKVIVSPGGAEGAAR